MADQQNIQSFSFNNNLDLLRLVAAVSVFFVHMHILVGVEVISPITSLLSSATAVNCFFVVSGFLIFSSFERSASTWEYIEKRIRRICPAYFTVVTLSALVLVFVSSLPATEYFGAHFFKYLFAQLTFMNFIEPTLPGTFTTNQVPAVNGALWSIRIEVLCYIMTPIVVVLSRRFLKRGYVLTLAYVLAIVAYIVLLKVAEARGSDIIKLIAEELPWEFAFYMSGAIIYYNFESFKRYAWFFLGIAVTLYVATAYFNAPGGFTYRPLSLAVIVLFIGFQLPHLGSFARYGDFSYGIYIIHFPVLQVFSSAGWLSKDSTGMVVVAVATVFALAVLLWHLIEKRFLKKGSPYIEVSSGKKGAAR